MLYVEVHQLADKKLKVAQIAKRLRISRTTVYKYLDMTFEEATNWVNSQKGRKKKLDPYKDWLLEWLREYPHISSAQIYDWLLERYPDLDFAESTCRLYVSNLREEYQIPKGKANPRQYSAVPLLPMGQQIQVDWGQTKQKTNENKQVKLYFIAFVLSHSRYKYVEWLDRPFTPRDTIQSHENAFQYFGGRTNELVYDQDTLIAVKENAGDIIYTSKFQAYKNARGFSVYLCRGADPESKGKIENVVKFIKGNFADSRIYTNLDNWNQRCIAWLDRTGNYKVHQLTKKRPAEVFAQEKQHLQPVFPILSNESTLITSITRVVAKDNTIYYKSNRYTLPIGSYKLARNNKVLLEIQKDDGVDTLLIYTPDKIRLLAKHQLSYAKGQLIRNNDHKREKSKAISELKDKAINLFKNKSMAKEYIGEILNLYPRYRRDQLSLIIKSSRNYSDLMDEALTKCQKEKLFSANDFLNVCKYISRIKGEKISPVIASKTINKYSHIKVTTRSLDSYTEILGRSQE